MPNRLFPGRFPGWRRLAGGGLFCLAFGERLLWLLTTHSQVTSTGEGTRAIDSLVNRGILGGIFPGSPGPSAHLAPLWPWLIATISRFTGWDHDWVGKLASLCCVGLAAALLPRLADKLAFPPATGWLAGLLLALAPVYTYSELFDYFTQPASMLVLVVFALWLPWEKSRVALPGRQLTGWGLALGVAGLLEPAVAVTAGLVMLLVIRRSQSSGRLIPVGLLGFVALGVVTPWLWRNHRELGGWIPIRGNFGLEFALGNQAAADGTAVRTPDGDLHPFTSASAARRLAQVGELAYSREVGSRAGDWVARHPVTFARLCLTRCRLYWFPPPQMLGSGRLSAWPRLVLLWSCTASIGWQLARGLGCHSQLRPGLAVFCLIPALPHLVTHVEMRYRQPIWGLELLLLSLTVCSLVNRLIRSERRELGTFATAHPSEGSDPGNDS